MTNGDNSGAWRRPGHAGPSPDAASRTLGSDPGLTPNLPRPSVIIPHMHPPVNRRLVAAAVVVLVLCTAPAAAQLPANMQDILRRIHTTQEFGAAGRGAGAGGRWVDGGAGYAAVERTPDGAAELVRYDTATGRRDVLMTAAQLTPPALGKPLQVCRLRRLGRRAADAVRHERAPDNDPEDRVRLLDPRQDRTASGANSAAASRAACYTRSCRPTGRARPTSAATTCLSRTCAPARPPRLRATGRR